MSGATFPEGLCTLQVIHHGNPQPSIPHLGSLLLPHDAFQEYATHPAEWSAALHSKGSERTCIRSGLATFLHCAFTARPRSPCRPLGRDRTTVHQRLDPHKVVPSKLPPHLSQRLSEVMVQMSHMSPGRGYQAQAPSVGAWGQSKMGASIDVPGGFR
jgi:hypothetical protein